MSNPPGQWAAAFVFCAAVFQFMWTYHALWRNKPYSLGTANECCALAAAYAVAAAVALGPLYRLTGRLRDLVRLRRPLGVVGTAFASVHGILQLTVKWEPLDKPGLAVGVVLGIAVLLLMLLLAATSWPYALRRYGAAGWKRIQSIGPWILVVILAHFIVQGKIPAWIEWFQTFGDPKHLPAPGGTLPLSVFGAAVLALRALDSRARRKG